MELSIFSDEFITANYYNIVILYFTILLIDRLCNLLAVNGLVILKVYKLHADLNRKSTGNPVIQNFITSAVGMIPYLNLIAIIFIVSLTLITELLLLDKKFYKAIVEKSKQRGD